MVGGFGVVVLLGCFDGRWFLGCPGWLLGCFDGRWFLWCPAV